MELKPQWAAKRVESNPCCGFILTFRRREIFFETSPHLGGERENATRCPKAQEELFRLVD